MRICACRSGPGKAQKLRTGYRGHLVQLANQLIVTAKDRPCLMQAFNAHPRWRSFVQNELQQANEVRMQAAACRLAITASVLLLFLV